MKESLKKLGWKDDYLSVKCFNCVYLKSFIEIDFLGMWTNEHFDVRKINEVIKS